MKDTIYYSGLLRVWDDFLYSWRVNPLLNRWDIRHAYYEANKQIAWKYY